MSLKASQLEQKFSILSIIKTKSAHWKHNPNFWNRIVKHNMKKKEN